MNVYFDRKPEPNYRFIPVSGGGYVAIHPEPQGVIQFIGGFFFGGWFPQWWHKALLRPLFEAKYTIIVNVFANSRNHWRQAIKLISFQEAILAEVKELAEKKGYDFEIYKQDPTDINSNYFWLGHSLGCKYIALLEILSDLEDPDNLEALTETVDEQEAKRIQEYIKNNDIDFKKVSLKNQPSILMAPVINDLSPILTSLGFNVQPSRQQTLDFIIKATQKNNSLFNLLSVIRFKFNNVEDNLAKETVNWIDEKIGGTDRLLTGKVQQVAVSYPELFLFFFIYGLLAHLVPVFFSDANDRELPNIILNNLQQLQAKYRHQQVSV